MRHPQPPPAGIDSKSDTARLRATFINGPVHAPRMAAPPIENEAVRTADSPCSVPLEGVEDRLRLQRLWYPAQDFGGGFP